MSLATWLFMSKESANMLVDVVPTRHVVSSSMVQTTESDDMTGQHSRHFYDMSACWWPTCHLGGSGDRTGCQHFQLSAPAKSCFTHFMQFGDQCKKRNKQLHPLHPPPSIHPNPIHSPIWWCRRWTMGISREGAETSRKLKKLMNWISRILKIKQKKKLYFKLFFLPKY